MALIGPEHPDYLEMFYKGFGAGQSFTGRQAIAFDRKKDKREPKHEPGEDKEDQ